MEPPASAVIKSRSASGKRSAPIWSHHVRMDFDGELGGVGDVADRDPALVVGQVVDAIGDGLAPLPESSVGEVVDLDPSGSPSG